MALHARPKEPSSTTTIKAFHCEFRKQGRCCHLAYLERNRTFGLQNLNYGFKRETNNLRCISTYCTINIGLKYFCITH